MNDYKTFKTITSLARKFGLDKSVVTELLEHRFLYQFEGKEISIRTSDEILLQFVKKFPQFYEIVLDLGSTYFYDLKQNDTRLELFIFEYLLYHNFLDKFCWLIKLNYSTRETVKSKKYRLDVLFNNFLVINNIKSQLDTTSESIIDASKSVFHIKKGWYNELVRSTPFNEESLNIGTKANGAVYHSGAMGWNIIQSYYSAYEYINSLVTSINPTINTQEHKKSIKLFSNSLYKNLPLNFPFNLQSTSKGQSKFPHFCNFEYARYPRNPSQDVWNIQDDILSSFKKLSTNEGDEKTFIDTFYNFRVWANYTGIESLSKLKNGYYLDFLKKNLGIVTFIMGGNLTLPPYIKTGFDD